MKPDRVRLSSPYLNSTWGKHIMIDKEFGERAGDENIIEDETR